MAIKSNTIIQGLSTICGVGGLTAGIMGCTHEGGSVATEYVSRIRREIPKYSEEIQSRVRALENVLNELSISGGDLNFISSIVKQDLLVDILRNTEEIQKVNELVRKKRSDDADDLIGKVDELTARVENLFNLVKTYGNLSSRVESLEEKVENSEVDDLTKKVENIWDLVKTYGNLSSRVESLEERVKEFSADELVSRLESTLKDLRDGLDISKRQDSVFFEWAKGIDAIVKGISGSTINLPGSSGSSGSSTIGSGNSSLGGYTVGLKSVEGGTSR